MDDRTYWILSRKDKPFTTYSLQKMLEQNGMESYFNVCFNRINDADLIDDDEIQLNCLTGCDIRLTAKGLWATKEILLGYLPEEWLIDKYADLKQLNRSERDMNWSFEDLRDFKVKDIKGLLKVKDIPEHYHDTWVILRKYLKLELWSRNLFVKMYFRIIDLWLDWKAKRIADRVFKQYVKQME